MAVQEYARDIGPDYADIANQLNEEWDEFGMQFDSFAYTMATSSKDAIQKAIADWQDWYYGNFDAWPDPARWYYILEQAKAILAVELQRGIKEITEAQRAEIEDKPISEEYAEPIQLDPIYIYGKVPKFETTNGADPFALSTTTKKKSGFPWGLIIIGGVFALAIASKKKRK